MLACINNFFCGVFQQPAQPSSERVHPAMSPRTYARAPIDFPVTRYWATAPAARSSSTASLYSELAQMRVVLDRPQAARTRIQPIHNNQRVPYRTIAQVAQHQIQFRTTSLGITYSTQPAVAPGLGNFYQINCTSQIIRRDYRGEPQRTAQTSLSTRPQLTHNQNALSLNQLEIHKAIKKITESDEKNEPEMLTIMCGLFRQEALNQIADRKAAQLEAQQQSLPVNQRQTVDRMETRLFYHSALKKRLQLPGKTIFMSCGERISVSEQEVQQAGDKVLRIEKLDSNSLIDFISKNEHWQNYLQKHYQSLHDQDSSITLHESRLEQLEDDLEQQKINDNEYLQRCNQLMRERETASKAWYHAKNHELIHKHLVPQGYPTSFNG